MLLFAAVLAGAMQAVRLQLIEPDQVAQGCLRQTQWHCYVRDIAIQGFVRHLYGPISVIAAVLAWWVGRWLAVPAMLAGMAGVVLYDFDWSALGLLLGALVWVHQRQAPVLPAQQQTE